MQNTTTSKPRSPKHGRRIVAQASISIAIGLILVGVLVGWLALRKFESTLGSNLRQRLEGYAQMVAMRFDARDLKSLSGMVSNLRDGEFLRDEYLIEYLWAKETIERLGLRRIVIFNTEGVVVVDTDDPRAAGRTDNRLRNHDAEISDAISSDTPQTTVRFPVTIDDKEVMSQMSFAALPNTLEAGESRFVAGVELPNDYEEALGEMGSIVLLWVGIFVAITVTTTGMVVLFFSRLQDRTDELRRKAELADFSGAIAHEIKNPLAAMLTGLQLLKRSLGEKERKIGDKLEREIHVIDRIVKDFLAFARGAERNPTHISMGEILARVRQQLTDDQESALLLKGDATIALDIDAVALSQALGNLVKNAAQSSLDAANQLGRKAQVSVQYQAAHGSLTIDIIDTGAGISESIRGRLFSPFVSGRAEGTGLGLAIVRRLVEDLRGHVELRATSDEGAHFRLEVPLKAKQEENRT